MSAARRSASACSTRASPSARDRDAVGDPAGQAGGGRLVRQRQFPPAGGGADVVLGHPGSRERRPGTPGGGRGDARPEAGGQVVGVGAGHDVGDAEPRGQRREDVDELGLAEGAAVPRVGPVALPRQLVGAGELVAHPERGAERGGGLALARRQAGRDGGRGDDPVDPECADGGGEHHAGVDAAGERDEHPGQRRELRRQGLESVVQRAHGGQVLTTAGSRRSPGRWHRRPRPARRAVRRGRRRRAGRARRSPGCAGRRSARWPPRR